MVYINRATKGAQFGLGRRIKRNPSLPLVARDAVRGLERERVIPRGLSGGPVGPSADIPIKTFDQDRWGEQH